MAPNIRLSPYLLQVTDKPVLKVPSTLDDDMGSYIWGGPLEDRLIDLVYSSNYIDVVGLNFDYTQALCKKVFSGLPVPYKMDIYVESRGINLARKDLLSTFPPFYQQHRPPTERDLLRSKLQVTYHAKALVFAIDHFITDGKPMTEDFLRQIHAILGHGILTDNDEGEAGQYRTWDVAAACSPPQAQPGRCGGGGGGGGSKKKQRQTKKKAQAQELMRASAVPSYMATLIKDLNQELESIDDDSKRKSPFFFDPFDLASRYAHRFVNIRPFGDGNGRMARILLNLLLIKYAGQVAALGGTQRERDRLLDIAVRGSELFYKEDDVEMDEADKTGHRELARFVLKHAKGGGGSEG